MPITTLTSTLRIPFPHPTTPPSRLFQPFGREIFSTNESVKRIAAAEGHGKGGDGGLFLSESAWERRACCWTACCTAETVDAGAG
ncbi:hypothetical protein PDIG_06230 [Penicillium digitatum PHI26]|uniref:Uncharacterized protein n=2 Tax=Penicillium digitatum TaxID=36651 RepID=K9H1U7_PEND2|nr:hypothetical protein PDIP_10910 [Penicillium digitatum Pd1]EKV19126.1 hypothetical protein PDIG_06230 [Penicillium digitatum PHI26]EKV21035.1 hypothetical protein PDIP_10910 [Penicillium digitatum Pd1]